MDGSYNPGAQFADAGYAHVRAFIDGGTARALTETLQVAAQSLAPDIQCSRSPSVHGHPAFDELLEKMLPRVERLSEHKLYPTYAYARLYQPGEVLVPHRDRPACEISVTLTLGFKGGSWPIFVGEGEPDAPLNAVSIDMQPGDAVLYKGCEKLHWREKYTQGEWQAQVFLHYVRRDGAYAGQRYDGRPSLTHQANTNGNFRSVPQFLTPAECERLLNSLSIQGGIRAGIGGDNRIDAAIRDATRLPLSLYRGIAPTLTGLGVQLNDATWQYKLQGTDQCEALRYTEEGHYHAHIDTFLLGSGVTRKLTVLLFLNDDFEGGRLFLQPENDKLYPPQGVGDVLIFPSFLLHGVEPVTAGTRWSVVTWLVGPNFQ